MHVDVFSDAICPWCWIGKRRLAAALEAEDLADIDIQWRAFQLYPKIPMEGMDRDEFMKLRFGSSGGGHGEAYRRIQEEGASVGIDFDFAAIRRMPNTLHAHRVIHHARGSGLQNAVVEALFTAYFCNGEDISDYDTLAEAAANGGLDRDEVRAMLDSDAGGEAVGQEIVWAWNNGVSGVPCFVLPNGFGVPGAQDPDTLARFMRRGLELVARSDAPADYSIVDATLQPLA